MTYNRNIRHLIVFTFFALILAGVVTLWPSGTEESEIPDHLLYVVATATTESFVTTTTSGPEPAPTTTITPTTVAPTTTTTAPAVPLAPPCSTWASQAEVDAWMAANAVSHDTSNIDTNGDGVACTLSFSAPIEAPAVSNVAPSGGGSGCVIPDYICQRESGHEGYSALNESSGAGGMYQFMPSTWNAVAAQIAPEWIGTPPHLAPPAVQDQFAAHLWAGGAGCYHWSTC